MSTIKYRKDKSSSNWIELIPFAPMSNSTTLVLNANGWDNDGKCVITGLPTSSATNGSLRIAQSATKEQRKAWSKAKIAVIGQTNGTLTVVADGIIPKIDIPVEVMVV